MNKYYLDANYVVSFLINRNDKQHKETKNIFNKATLKELSLILLTEIVIEVEYTLRNRYHISKSHIVSDLTNLISFDYIKVSDRNILIESLKLFELNNVDLVDCILYSKAKANDADVVSFDKDFNKLKIAS